MQGKIQLWKYVRYRETKKMEGKLITLLKWIGKENK